MTEKELGAVPADIWDFLARVPGEFAESEHLNHFATLLGLAVRDLSILFLHLLATLARLAGPGGARSVLAESVLV